MYCWQYHVGWWHFACSYITMSNPSVNMCSSCVRQVARLAGVAVSGQTVAGPAAAAALMLTAASSTSRLSHSHLIHEGDAWVRGFVISSLSYPAGRSQHHRGLCPRPHLIADSCLPPTRAGRSQHDGGLGAPGDADSCLSCGRSQQHGGKGADT
jgi:hypothetical protein